LPVYGNRRVVEIMKTTTKQMDSHFYMPTTQVKISVDSDLATAFKAACLASNVSMTAEISQFMENYVNGYIKRRVAPNYSSRRHRRSAIKAMIKELELIRACEEKVLNSTPDNLHGSCVYDATEDAISTIDEAIYTLAEF